MKVLAMNSLNGGAMGKWQFEDKERREVAEILRVFEQKHLPPWMKEMLDEVEAHIETLEEMGPTYGPPDEELPP